MYGDPAARLRDFEENLAQAQAQINTDDKANGSGGGEPFHVPDLIALAGPAHAEVLLRQVLSLPLGGLEFHDADTASLACRVLPTTGDRLRCAAWSLVDEPGTADLYETLHRSFPNLPTRSSQPDAFYLLDLIVAGREDATTAPRGWRSRCRRSG